MIPRYPIFIPSKGRHDKCLTAIFLKKENISFKIIVEPQEEKKYSDYFGRDNIMVLPFRDKGLVTALNWLWDHPVLKNSERYWYMDDNIRGFWRYYKGIKIRCDAIPAICSAEDFTDRYENIAITGFNYYMFAPEGEVKKPFLLNHHVYSCELLKREIPFRWRGPYNADTDLCLQVLSQGWCTIQINTFLIWKETTMKMKGGNTDSLYKGDGRLKMARSLERLWPGVVEVKRRFNRPQHVIKFAWEKFDTQLRLKASIDLASFKKNEYGLELKAVKEISHPRIKALLNKQQEI